MAKFQTRYKSNDESGMGHHHQTPLPLDQLLLQKEDDGESKIRSLPIFSFSVHLISLCIYFFFLYLSADKFLLKGKRLAEFSIFWEPLWLFLSHLCQSANGPSVFLSVYSSVRLFDCLLGSFIQRLRPDWVLQF